MRVVQIILFEFLLGYILQSFSIVLGLYAFNRQKIDRKKYIITSLVMSVVIYVTRILPVAFGVHTVLDYVALFLLGILYLKLPARVTIEANLVIVIIIIIIEAIDTLALTFILGNAQFSDLVNDVATKCLIGLPSSILVTFTVAVLYFKLSCNKRITKEK